MSEDSAPAQVNQLQQDTRWRGCEALQLLFRAKTEHQDLTRTIIRFTFRGSFSVGL